MDVTSAICRAFVDDLRESISLSKEVIRIDVMFDVLEYIAIECPVTVWYSDNLYPTRKFV
ncbi:MAG: hypothetical protein IPJ13_23300 [Saprospiraceae bacterium]|nr:hypothetical protein [Saprospiraceae bacterium]